MEFQVDSFVEVVWLYLPKVLLGLAVIVVGFWLSSRFAAFVARTLRKRKIDPTVIPFLRSFISVVFKVMVLLTAAGIFGIDATSFIAIFSALTLAIGLALQSNLSHFASGLLLLTLRPYKVGDVVTIGGQTGKVEAIQIFHTIVSTPDNQRHIVPNGRVTADTITNISGQGTRGVELNFGIAYDDDVAKAREIILREISQHGFILPEPIATVVVTALNDSSVNLMARPFVLSQNFWATKVELTERIKQAFDAEGITIPFPQRTVWMQTNNGATAPQGASLPADAPMY